jgi:hypothetical protein
MQKVVLKIENAECGKHYTNSFSVCRSLLTFAFAFAFAIKNILVNIVRLKIT